MRSRYTLFLLLVIIPAFIRAQMIDNSLSFKNINRESYIRFNYENDFFSATDWYYTQGINLEVVTPWLKKFPLSRLLIHPVKGKTRYGLGVEYEGFTPIKIESAEIIHGDRPFAGCLFLQSFLQTTDTVHRRRFSATLSTGILGPGAGVDKMQTEIHEFLPHNGIPKGWKNQLQNTPVINYEVNYESELYHYAPYFVINGNARGRLGTLSDKVGAGLTFMAGYFIDPFSTRKALKRMFRIYAYEHPEVSLVGYDATLQGGMFSRSDPYTINSQDITRFTFANRFGIVVSFGGVHLEYFQSYISQEFNTGRYHVWGGIQIACTL